MGNQKQPISGSNQPKPGEQVLDEGEKVGEWSDEDEELEAADPADVSEEEDTGYKADAGDKSAGSRRAESERPPSGQGQGQGRPAAPPSRQGR
jgi:hypothetical protein